MPEAVEKQNRDNFVFDPIAIGHAATEAVRDALLRHKLLGQSIVVWENGKCVWVAPEDIQIPDAPDTHRKQAG